jgi:hypothetical protein
MRYRNVSDRRHRENFVIVLLYMSNLLPTAAREPFPGITTTESPRTSTREWRRSDLCLESFFSVPFG